MQRIISTHNSKVLRDSQNQDQVVPFKKNCNCRTKNDCPLDGQCLASNLIYQATVSQENGKTENYVGLTSNPFKTRLANHKKSFKHEKYSHETTLSQHIWKLNKSGIKFTLKWKMLNRAGTFSPVTNVCQLCTREKYLIIFKPEMASLNSRNEIASICRHKQKMLFDKT